MVGGDEEIPSPLFSLERRETASIQTALPKKSSPILWCSLEVDTADPSQHGAKVHR
jgi:hypothetical protein